MTCDDYVWLSLRSSCSMTRMECVLCPELTGRSAEIDALTEALDAAEDGHGGVVFITGDDGVGKSRLAKYACSLAGKRGFDVMGGRGTQSAVPAPYRPVIEALLGAARAGVAPTTPEMTAISNYRAALGSLVPEWRRPGDAHAHVSPVVVGEALLRILTGPGRNGGVLILEDLHWADPETLAIVEYLADNVSAMKVLCVITLRNSVPSACLDLMQAAAARRVATRVDVPRLTPAAVKKMAAACLRVEVLPAAVSRLLADCDGLPFAVEEILTAAVSSGKLVRDESGWQVNSDVSTGVPDSIAGSVRRRLASLGPAVSNVIVSAAVLGRQFDWALLPGVAGVTESDALEAVQRACEVRLIEPVAADAGSFRFRYSLTRESILSDLMPPDLACRAVTAAAAIEQAHPGVPGTWCELVAELRALAGQPAEAARLLVTAARRALLQGAISSAMAALRDAGELLSEPSVDEPLLGIDVDEVLLEALEKAGDAKQLAPLAAGLIERLEAAGADPRRIALVRLRSARTRPEDNPAAASEHLAAAADIASRLHDPELASRIDAVAARNALAAGDLDTADGLARRSLAMAEAAGLSGWAAEVAVESLEVAGRRERVRDLGAARTAFERSRQIADSHGELGIWRIRSRHELATLDMLTEQSADRLREVRELAREAGASCVGTRIDLQLANLWSLGTDLDQALAAARQCQRTASQIRAPRIEAMALCLLASIAAIRGEGEQVEEAAQRAESVLPDDPEILITTWGQARVLAALFRDDLSRALRADARAESCADDALAAPHGYSALQAPLLSPRRALGLHALLRAVADHDGRGAIKQATSAAADASWNAGCLAYAEAVLEGRDGHARRATSLAEEASMHFAPFAPWWNHLARRLVAPAALGDGWGQPVAWMYEAACEFESTAHDRLASGCRGVLRRAGERVPRSGRGDAQVPSQMRRLGITSREMDVFLLVARGESNSQIGARLCISPKTVETHVASLIAKTGRTGRRELVAHAARLAPS
jgi:DNA-binding CsgD family transcriptional regulator